MTADERFDGMYLQLAQQCGGIEPLLDSLFGFLRRKTDFFSGADEMQIENTVLTAVRTHAEQAKAAGVREEKIKQAKKKKEEQAAEAKRRKKEEAEKEKKKVEGGGPVKAPAAGVVELGNDGTFDSSAADDSAAASSPPPAGEGDGDGDGKGKSDEGGKAGDEGEEEEEDKTPAPLGNGGTCEHYTWTQTLSEVNVVFPVPLGTKSRDVVCDISSRKMKLGLKGKPLQVDGELPKKVITEDCFWTLEDGDNGKEVSILLQKDNKMEWWSSVIVGDATIDTSKVVPENSKLDDLDSQTRQTVEKMMFDQRQKAQGLPTADEMQKQEMLSKFMSAHPEMDFSERRR